MGGQTIGRWDAFTEASDNSDEMGGMSRSPSVCEMCMARIASCISDNCGLCNHDESSTI